MEKNMFHKLKKIIKNIDDPLYKNSLYLMLTSLTSTGSGFIFWVTAAKLYDPQEVGLAVATISAIGLICLFSKFGLEIGIIRYLPKEQDKSKMINSCLTAIFFSTMTISTIYILGLNVFSPKLLFLKENVALILSFLIFTISDSLFSFENNVFVAIRNAKYSMFQSLLATSRVIFLPLLISYSFVGIYISYGIGATLAIIFGIYLIWRSYPNYKFVLQMNNLILVKMIHFSVGNYLAIILEVIPNYLLPLLIIHILGPEMNAYFYIAWSFSAIISMIPKATSTSLFAEGLHFKEELRLKTIKAFKFTISLLMPTIILIFLIGNHILSLFGVEYSKYSIEMLYLFAISGIPYTLNVIYMSIMRVRGETMHIIYGNGVLSFFFIFGTLVFTEENGLSGIGYSWLIANLVLNICIGIIEKNEIISSMRIVWKTYPIKK